MVNDYAQSNFGAAKRFRLIIREGGQSREMGGDDMSIAVGIVDNIFMNALETGTVKTEFSTPPANFPSNKRPTF
jgi:hypothetical protein